MDKESFISDIRFNLIKYYRKAKYTKIKFLKMYYLGKCYTYQELYLRMTGIDIDISLAYFSTRGHKEMPLWIENC